MPGVPRELIEHSLNLHPQPGPKKQRLRRFAHDKREAIKREIAKLLAAGFIKEVISSLCEKRIMNGECVLTTLISTSIARRIISGYRALIKSSTRWQVVCSSVSLILLFRLSPYCAQGVRPNQDRVHHPVLDICLQNYVLRVEKRKSNLSARDPDVLC
jgi:hypothetical protein